MFTLKSVGLNWHPQHLDKNKYTSLKTNNKKGCRQTSHVGFNKKTHLAVILMFKQTI